MFSVTLRLKASLRIIACDLSDVHQTVLENNCDRWWT